MTLKTYWISTGSNNVSLPANWSAGLPTELVDGVIDSSHGATVWPSTGILTANASIYVVGDAHVGSCVFNLGVSASSLRYRHFVAQGGTLNGTTINTLGDIRIGSASSGTNMKAKCSVVTNTEYGYTGLHYWSFDTLTFIDCLPPIRFPDFESIKQSPIPHIIHTNDFVDDIDGGIALMMLAYLDRMGYCKLEGVLADSNYMEARDEIDAVLSFYGIADVPIGIWDLAHSMAYDDSNVREGFKSNQIRTCAKLRAAQLGASAYEDSTAVLRRVLGGATEPITILSTGADYTVRSLTETPANYNGDGLPSGIDLIKAHVSKFIFGGGYFYKTQGSANVISPELLATWYSQLADVPIEFAGEEMCDNQGRDIIDSDGDAIFFEAGLKIGTNKYPDSHPARWLYGSDIGNLELGDSSSFGYGRTESHDIIRAFYAVFGRGSWFTLSAPGHCTDVSNWTWVGVPGALSHYIISPVDITELSELVENTMLAAALGTGLNRYVCADNLPALTEVAKGVDRGDGMLGILRRAATVLGTGRCRLQ